MDDWRCPHCRTLQPETIRCRACSRTAVACSTCHLYRTSVAGDLGYCARDRSRTPLGADEVRPCWEAGAPGPDVVPGLFSGIDVSLPTTVASEPEMADNNARPGTAASLPTVAPSADDRPGLRAGGLVDAPHIAPGRGLVSELQRRLERA